MGGIGRRGDEAWWNALLGEHAAVSRKHQLHLPCHFVRVVNDGDLVEWGAPFSREESWVVGEERREVDMRPSSICSAPRDQAFTKYPGEILPLRYVYERR